MELLRRTLAEQQSNPGRIVRTPQSLGLSTNATIVAARKELEQQFLDGKITAKQFQRGLEQLQQEDQRRAALATKADGKLAAKTTTPSPAASVTNVAATAAANNARRATNPPVAARVAAPAAAVAPAAAAVAPAAEATPELKKISEVEARLEQMERQKAAREKAALTNAAPTTTNAPAMTKRQKLDALLKEMIEGKVSEADYNAKRAKLIAEPD
jgi:hypothetical protein